MSSKSVFKFKINQNKAEDIDKIVKQYLIDNSFRRADYNSPWFKELTGPMIYPIGLEYTINNDVLIIKAYTFGVNHSSTRFIHSVFNNTDSGLFFYSELKKKLFKQLEEKNVTLINKDIEKINDGIEFNAVKIILIYALILVIFTIVCALVFLDKELY